MPRQPRYGLVEIPQHVVQKGNNHQSTFFAIEDYHHYLGWLREACLRYECRVHAYVLMTNHVHLLITPAQPDAIGKVMQSVGRRYVRYVNTTYRRSGTLWEGRYKASPIDAQYVLTCARFIELNPARASTGRDPVDYRWSSYAHHAGLRVDPLISEHASYLALGRTPAQRQAAYRELFQERIDPTAISTIREASKRCLVLGTESFKDQIEQVLARRVRHGKPGRPRKELTAGAAPGGAKNKSVVFSGQKYRADHEIELASMNRETSDCAIPPVVQGQANEPRPRRPRAQTGKSRVVG